MKDMAESGRELGVIGGELCEKVTLLDDKSNGSTGVTGEEEVGSDEVGGVSLLSSWSTCLWTVPPDNSSME